jgi:hypothetical protein
VRPLEAHRCQRLRREPHDGADDEDEEQRDHDDVDLGAAALFSVLGGEEQGVHRWSLRVSGGGQATSS